MARELTIVTPEHVHIRLEPAGMGSRFLALLIDALIPLGITWTLAGILRGVLPGGITMAIGTTMQFFLSFGWHIWFETRRQGQTPGKRALRLRVVDARGLPVSVYQSLVRNIVRVLDFLPMFYGFGALVLIMTGGRRFGDLVADTVVIRESKPLIYEARLEASRRHNSLRTPRVIRLIRHRISLEEREFLLALCLRADKMTPAARYDVMEEVAAVYRQKLGIEDEQISGENLVRDLTSAIFDPRGEERRPLPRAAGVR
jgi:uncharacterized RDD family membrane protein YckC